MKLLSESNNEAHASLSGAVLFIGGIREDSREEVYFTHYLNIMKIELNGLIYKTWEKEQTIQATFNKIL